MLTLLLTVMGQEPINRIMIPNSQVNSKPEERPYSWSKFAQETVATIADQQDRRYLCPACKRDHIFMTSAAGLVAGRRMIMAFFDGHTELAEGRDIGIAGTVHVNRCECVEFIAVASFIKRSELFPSDSRWDSERMMLEGVSQ